MSRMRGWSWLRSVALLTVAASAAAGCRSADSGSGRTTREPPIAARPRSVGDVIQTAAVESADSTH